MPTIEDQLKLESGMIGYGVARFKGVTSDAEAQGRGSDTTYARTLIKSLLMPLAESIDEYKDKSVGIGARYRKLLKEIDSEKAAYFTLKAVFNHFMKEETVQTLALSIGWYIEDELKFSQFQTEHTEYYNTILEDFQRKGTKNYRWMHRVLTFKANEKQVQWVNWTSEERLKVGTALLDLLSKSTDLIERKTVTLARRKKKVLIVPTASALEWVEKHMQNMSILNPDRTPCIIEPDPWTAYDQGGYYSPRLRMRSPLVKTRSNEHLNLLRSSNLSQVMAAVNTLQSVPWSVNSEVLEVMTQVWEDSLGVGLPASEPMQIPGSPVARDLNKKDMDKSQLESFNNWKKEAAIIHTMEKERISKCFQVSRVMRLARAYTEYDRFWYVYQCDFRGRMYCATAGFSPQGPDFAKGLLQFAEGKELGETGLYWLKVHGANTYGEDKISYDDRVQWIDANEELLLRCAEDPLRHRDFWGEADKPWQFLAFVFEFKRAHTQGGSFVSHLPIALDGSCNGLQNFSAMLRDRTGATATNITAGEVPADIYAEVSRVLTKKVIESEHEYKQGWLNFITDYGDNGKFSRKLAKRPVMTLPYGSTRQSCTEYVFKYLMEECPEYFPITDRYKRTLWLTQLLWDSIGEVVVAAREGMDWLQRAAGTMAKENQALIWFTPAGFPVYQGTRKFITRQIDTQLSGRVQFVFGTDSEDLDVRRQKQGISPNFVHSMDACHLMLALNKGVAQDIDTFACIHDDFGTYAADTAKWHRLIREAFVDLYSTNVLEDFKESHEKLYMTELPELPSSGDLNIEEVLDSKYFFG